MRLPGETNTEFVVFRPFVPVSEQDQRKELVSFMVARSDADHYGQLQVYEMPQNVQVDGPAIVASNIRSDSNISEQFTLLGQHGSEIKQGNLLIVPINNTLLYVRPVYVQAAGSTPIPELRKVIVSANGRIVMADTLQDALNEIFGAAPPTNEGQEGGGPQNPPPETGNADVQALLDQAAQAFNDADAALADKDLSTYAAKIAEARGLVDQARALAGQTPSGSTTTTAPGSSTTTTTAGPAGGSTTTTTSSA
jgi:hypothetical protein